VSWRVLLCDDEPNYRRLLRAVLEPEGMEIVGEAGDGRECLEVAERVHPDVILLDLNMPGMDGLTALPELRAREPGAAVVVLSSAEREEAEERTIGLGAHAFLTKPRDIFAVPGLVRAAVD
jgi:CheY-like chemotaxis protein